LLVPLFCVFEEFQLLGVHVFVLVKSSLLLSLQVLHLALQLLSLFVVVSFKELVFQLKVVVLFI